MADVVGSAAIKIEPDVSGLSRALEQALGPVLAKVAKQLRPLENATDGIAHGLNKAAVAGKKLNFSGAAKDLASLSKAAETVEKSLGKISVGDIGVSELRDGIDASAESAQNLGDSISGLDFSQIVSDTGDLIGYTLEYNEGLEEAIASASGIRLEKAVGDSASLSRSLDGVTGKMSQAAGASAEVDLSKGLATSVNLADLLEVVAANAAEAATESGNVDFSGGVASASDMEKALEGVKRESAGLGDAGARAGTDYGSQFGAAAESSMLGKLSGTALKLTGVLAAAATASGGIFAGRALLKGADRLNTIEDSTAALTIQLGDAAETAKLVASVLETVKGTPFNLDQFVAASRTLVTFGADTKDIPRYLTAIGEAAAGSGQGIEAVTRITDVFSQSLIANRITLDSTQRLVTAGVPVYKILANSVGVAEDAVMDMVSAGQFGRESIDVLIDGILNGSEGVAGSTNALAGSMEALRQTYTGAVGGLGAATARLGAAFLEPFREQTVDFVLTTTDVVDSLSDSVKRIATVLADAGFIQRFGEKLSLLPPFIERVGAAIEGLYRLIAQGDFSSAFQEAFGIEEDSPIVDFLLDLRDTVIAAGDAFTTALSPATEGAKATFSGFAALIQPLVNHFSALLPIIPEIAGLIGELLAVFAPLRGVIIDLAIDVLSVFVDALGDVLPVLVEVSETIAGTLSESLPGLGDSFAEIIEALLELIPPLAEVLRILLELIPPVVDFTAAALKMKPVVWALAAAFLAWKTGLLGLVAGAVMPTLVSQVTRLGLSMAHTVTQSLGMTKTAGNISKVFEGTAVSMIPISASALAIAAGIAAVAAAFTLAYFHIQPFRDAVDKVIDVFQIAIPALIDFGKRAIGFLVDQVKIAWDVFKGFARFIGAIFTGDFDEVKQRLRDFANSIVDYFKGLPGRLADVLGDLPSRLGEAFAPLWGFLQDIGPRIGEFFTRIPEFISNAFGNIGPLLSAFGDTLANGFSNAFGLLQEYGPTLLVKGLSFLGMAGEWALDALGNLGDILLGWLGAGWDWLVTEGPGVILSALELYANVHIWILERLGDLGGILLGWAADGAAWLLGQLPGVLGTLVDWFGNIAGWILGRLGDLGLLLLHWIGGAFAWIVDSLPGVVEGLADWFVDLPFKILGWLGDLGGLLIGWITGGLDEADPGEDGGGIGQWFIELPGKILGWLGDLAGLLIGWVGDGFVALWNALPGIVSTIGDGFAALPGLIGSALTGLGGLLWEALTGAVSFVVNRGPDILAGILRIWTAFPRAIGEKLVEVGPSVLRAIGNAIVWVVERIPGFLGELLGFFASIPGRIIDLYVGFYSWLWDDVIQPAFAWVIDNLPGVISAIAGFIVGLPERILSAFGAGAGWLWENVIQPAGAWVIAELPGLLTTIGEFFVGLPGMILNLFTGGASWLWDSVIKPAGEWVIRELPGILGSIVGFIIDIPFLVLEGIIGGAGWLFENVFAPAFEWVQREGPGLLGKVLGFLSKLPGLALKAVGAAASWLWDSVIQPAGEWVIRELPGLLGKIVGFIVDIPFLILEGLIGGAAWLFENIFVPAFDWVVTELPGILGGVIDFFTDLPGYIVDGLVAGNAWIYENIFVPAWDWVVQNGPTAAAAVLDWFKNLPGYIVSAIGGAASWLYDSVIKPAWDWVVENVPKAAAAVFDWFRGLPGRIADAIGDLGSALWDRVQLGFDFFRDKIIEFFEKLPERAGAAVDAIVDFFVKLPGRITGLIGNIGEVFGNIGGAILDGIISGIGAVGGFIADIGNGLINWVNDNVIDHVNDGIAGLAEKIPFPFPGKGRLVDEGALPRIPNFAYGDVVNQPTLGVFGEAGPEVILPLSDTERMIELLTEALRMSGRDVPEFDRGAIFNTAGSGGRSGPHGSIESLADLMPPDRFILANAAALLAASRDELIDPRNVLIKSGSLIGNTPEFHYRLYGALWNQGWQPKKGEFDDTKIMGTLQSGVGEMRLGDASKKPGRNFSIGYWDPNTFGGAEGEDWLGKFTPVWKIRIQQLFSYFARERARELGIKGRRSQGFTIPQKGRGDAVRLIERSGLGIEYDEDAKQWVAVYGTSHIPISVPGLAEDAPWTLLSENKDLMTTIARALRGDGKQLTGDEFVTAFNRFSGVVQDIVIAAPFVPREELGDDRRGFESELLQRIGKFAEGGVVSTPTLGVFGEAGPEVIVPLSKPGRMVELLTTALGMTGDLPQYGGGAIFSKIGTGEGKRPDIAISSIKDLYPSPDFLRQVAIVIGAISNNPDFFRKFVPGTEAKEADPKNPFSVDQAKPSEYEVLLVDASEGARAAFKGNNQAAHLQLIHSLQMAGYNGRVFEDGSGSLGPIRLGSFDDKTTEGPWVSYPLEGYWQLKLQAAMNLFAKAAADSLPGILKNSPTGPKGSYLFDLESQFDRIDLLRKNGMKVDFDREKGQWFVEGKPVSRAGIKDSSIPFNFKSTDPALQKRIEAVWEGREFKQLAPEDFVDAFNRLTGTLQEIILVQPFIPPEKRAETDVNVEALLKSIATFASGDVVSTPTLGVFGEAGPEVIFPLTKGDRMIDLSLQALDMAGVAPSKLMARLGVPAYANGGIIGSVGASRSTSVTNNERSTVIQMEPTIVTAEPERAADELVERFQSQIFRQNIQPRVDF